MSPECLGRSLFKSSPISDNPDLVELKASMEALTPVSMENEEYILDVPFTVEEVEKAIK